MKKYYLASFVAATVIFSGCGGGGDTSSVPATTTDTPTTITVQRGPILGAIVTDTVGNVAKEVGNGDYTFKSTPIYPVVVSGGVIDIDRDGVISVGDVANDLNLSTTSGSVVTMATTLATNPKTKSALDQIANSLNLTIADVFSKTPSESKEIEAISNVLYKYIKDNGISDLLDTTDPKILNLDVTAITTDVDTKYNEYISDDNHDFAVEEENLMQTLSDKVNDLDQNEVDDELNRLETVHAIYETYKDNETELKDRLKIEVGDDIDSLAQGAVAIKNEYEIEYGDIDYEDDGGANLAHFQGENCLKCHGTAGLTTTTLTALYREIGEVETEESEESEESRETGETGETGESETNEANENQFTSGATIFTALNAANNDVAKTASNYSLRLVLENGTSIENYNIGRGTGNVYGTFNAGISKYTAEVLNSKGEVVNSSATNSHDASRFDCNSCHTAAGINGAPGRIVSFNYTVPVVTVPVEPVEPVAPVEPVTPVEPTPVAPVAPLALSFANDVEPVLQAKCAACHGGSGNFSITNSATPYAGVTPFVKSTDAANSSLLLKATNQIGHGGGAVISTTSTEYTSIRDWISQGALDN